MGYYTNSASIGRVDEVDLGLIVTATTDRPDKVVQCYVSGDLVDWQHADQGVVRFVLPQGRPGDPILLLVVDEADADTDYWSDAFGVADTYGNRIQVDFTLDLFDGRQPGDVWRVYRGDAGDDSADIELYEAPVFPGGRGALGWGTVWASDGWGYGAANAPGWGYHWGLNWGFGIDYLRYVTQPLLRGTYPIQVEVEDRHGNTSTAYTTTIVVDTYARPADDLAVSSYDSGADSLVLTLTPSEDL